MRPRRRSVTRPLGAARGASDMISYSVIAELTSERLPMVVGACGMQ
jgi:hypothetical protein